MLFNNFKKKQTEKLKSLSKEELLKQREKVRPISISGSVSVREQREALHKRDLIDEELSRRERQEFGTGFPKHSSGGWHITSED